MFSKKETGKPAVSRGNKKNPGKIKNQVDVQEFFPRVRQEERENQSTTAVQYTKKKDGRSRGFIFGALAAGGSLKENPAKQTWSNFFFFFSTLSLLQQTAAKKAKKRLDFLRWPPAHCVCTSWPFDAANNHVFLVVSKRAKKE